MSAQHTQTHAHAHSLACGCGAPHNANDQGLLREEAFACTACAGTLLLELGLLSQLTGRRAYRDAAHRAALLLFRERSSLGLVRRQCALCPPLVCVCVFVCVLLTF